MIEKFVAYATEAFNAFGEFITKSMDKVVDKIIEKATLIIKKIMKDNKPTRKTIIVKKIAGYIGWTLLTIAILYQMYNLIPIFLYFVPTYIAFRILATLTNKIMNKFV